MTESNIRRKDKRGVPAAPGVSGGAYAAHEREPAVIEPLTPRTWRIGAMARDMLFTAAHPKTGEPTAFRKIWDEDRWLIEDVATEECWRMHHIDDNTVEDARQGPPSW